MKAIFATLLAVLLAGCAAAPIRSASTLSEAPPFEAAVPQRAPIRPSPVAAVQPIEKRQFGVIDYLWDRFRDRPATPTAGTVFDTRAGVDFPFAMGDDALTQRGVYSSDFADSSGVLPA